MSNSSRGNIIDISLLKRVLKYTIPYKNYFFIALFTAIILSLLGPIRPVLINFTVDNYILIPNPEGLLRIIIIIFSLLVIEGIVQFFYIYLSSLIGQHVIQDLRSKIFEHIISLKMRYFDKTPIGKLVTRTISDVETISDIFSQGLLVIIAELLKLVIIIFLMFYTNWQLTFVTLLTIPILIFSTIWFKRNIKKSFQDVRDQVANLNTFVQEHLSGMNIVQIFNQEDREFLKFKKINMNHRDAHLRSIFYYAVFFPIVEILSATSIALIVWYGGHAILSGKEMTEGELIAFILFVYMMFRPIRQLADRFNILQMGIVGAERIFKVLDYNDKIEVKENILSDFEGDIEFHDVYFGYNTKMLVLKKINLSIKSNKMLALVGSTGSGKTSIINILMRFYDYSKGEIKIGGTSIRKFNLKYLRSNIGLIQQEVFLFSDTIFNNITLHDRKIKKEDVVIAAKKIGVHNFINSLPDKYDYIVGERGVTLSSGQRQLIAFLRVYLRNPKIIILDEATSSVDSKTELMIKNALEKVSHKRTTIVIAHRLSTITNADKILYLEQGKILEEGTHEQLLKKKSYYHTLFNKQKET
ncbi:MAG: antibiotic ABC transporter ATP-binding protein [Flavobacteriales bacterium]|nr:antibiotic ABC transporter ATP-binding protein [Flavobacteriales bacterium]